MFKDFSRALLHFFFVVVWHVLIDFAFHCVFSRISFVEMLQYDSLLDEWIRIDRKWRDVDRKCAGFVVDQREIMGKQ